MKKLVFDYEMKLSFSSPVTDHRFQLRCIPATGPRQQVIDVAVKIEPDVELETTIDSFDSVVMTGFIPEPHTMFNYSVTGIAFVDNAHIKSEIYKPLYRFNSALTVPGPAIEALIGICRERIASLPADCTPIDRRFTPSARRSLSSSSFVVSGFTSTVISESRRTLPMRFSSSRISTMRFAP